jgi:hypothetical protein
MFCTYYHGWYGNIFFSKIFVQKEIFSNQAHFLKLFLMQTKYIRNVQKMFFAYYHGNIPPSSQFLWKMKLLKSSPFFKIIFKARIEKNIKNVMKKCFKHIMYYHTMATYPTEKIIFWWKMKFFQIKPIFAYYFKARIKKNIRNVKKMFQRAWLHISLIFDPDVL